MLNTYILKALVGSRAHGIETPSSDYDYKAVFFAPRELFFDPWSSPPQTLGKDDNVAYEYQHFVRLCTSGNPTALEVLFSAAAGNTALPDTGVYAPTLGQQLVDMRYKLLDSERIYHAHRGFAASQLKKLEKDDVTPYRYRKALATYVRVMGMGIDFFKQDVYNVRVPEKRRQTVREIRSLSDEATERYSHKQVIARMELALDEAFECRKVTHEITEQTKQQVAELALAGYGG